MWLKCFYFGKILVFIEVCDLLKESSSPVELGFSTLSQDISLYAFGSNSENQITLSLGQNCKEHIKTLKLENGIYLMDSVTDFTFDELILNQNSKIQSFINGNPGIHKWYFSIGLYENADE